MVLQHQFSHRLRIWLGKDRPGLRIARRYPTEYLLIGAGIVLPRAQMLLPVHQAAPCHHRQCQPFLVIDAGNGKIRHDPHEQRHRLPVLPHKLHLLPHICRKQAQTAFLLFVPDMAGDGQPAMPACLFLQLKLHDIQKFHRTCPDIIFPHPVPPFSAPASCPCRPHQGPACQDRHIRPTA